MSVLKLEKNNPELLLLTSRWIFKEWNMILIWDKNHLKYMVIELERPVSTIIWKIW